MESENNLNAIGSISTSVSSYRSNIGGGGGFLSNLGAFFSASFTYSTVREARVRSFKVALIFRTIQLLILAYIIGYVIYLAVLMPCHMNI
jgi:hypothetical protein